MGVARIDEKLPDLVYALLTGLNAATVGIIALAAVQLSQKAITDKPTRILVFMGGTAGMLYTTLWYFPVLMVVGGLSTVVWDYRWPHKAIRRLRCKAATSPPEDSEAPSILMVAKASREPQVGRNPTRSTETTDTSPGNTESQANEDEERRVPASLSMRVFSWKFGVAVIACFFVTFAIIMILRGVLRDPPRGFSLFANLYLAGML